MSKTLRTPWGQVQNTDKIIDGILSVSTSSHGGLKLDRKRNAKVPKYLRRKGGWYEEDCEWAIPYVVFAEEIKADEKTQEVAIQAFKSWFPDEYEIFTGTQLQPGESYIRDEKNFYVENANKYVVIAAQGDWSKGTPKGMVLVDAILGRDNRSHDRLKYAKQFYIPAAEYKKRSKFGYIIPEDAVPIN